VYGRGERFLRGHDAVRARLPDLETDMELGLLMPEQASRTGGRFWRVHAQIHCVDHDGVEHAVLEKKPNVANVCSAGLPPFERDCDMIDNCSNVQRLMYWVSGHR
jgi:hypothetical protein